MTGLHHLHRQPRVNAASSTAEVALQCPSEEHQIRHMPEWQGLSVSKPPDVHIAKMQGIHKHLTGWIHDFC